MAEDWTALEACNQERLALRESMRRFLEDCESLLVMQPGPQNRIAALEKALQDERNAQFRGDGVYVCPTCGDNFRWSDGISNFGWTLSCDHPQMPNIMRLARQQREEVKAARTTAAESVERMSALRAAVEFTLEPILEALRK